MSSKAANFSDLSFELKMDLAKAFHDFVAKSKLPLDSVVSLSMTTKVEADHYDADSFDAFCDYFAALNVSISI